MVEITSPDGSPFPANRYVVSKGGNRELVVYWFQAHGREVASEYWAKYYLVRDSVRLHRTDGSLIRVATPLTSAETPDQAQRRLLSFAENIVPLLNLYIPR